MIRVLKKPLLRVNLCTPFNLSTRTFAKKAVPEEAKSTKENTKSTAAFSIEAFAKKNLETTTPVDDVFGTGPKTLENLANLSSRPGVKLPNITFAHQLIGLYLLDEHLYDEVMLKVQGLQQNREHIKSSLKQWCIQHGIDR
jgi:hypothetical protein